MVAPAQQPSLPPRHRTPPRWFHLLAGPNGAGLVLANHLAHAAGQRAARLGGQQARSEFIGRRWRGRGAVGGLVLLDGCARFLNAQAGVLDDLAQRGPVFDLARYRAAHGLRGLARLLDERMGELDGGEGSGGHGYLLIGAFCAN